MDCRSAAPLCRKVEPMSAGATIQAALATSIGSVAELTGVFDGPPARATFPYAAIDASTETDWSHKNGSGREVLVAVTLWDDQPARLQSLADEIEARVLAIEVASEWQLVSLSLVRRRTIRDVAGPWATAVDFRARLLAG
jgi:hypothetical protein